MESKPLRVLVIDDDKNLSDAILDALSVRGIFAAALRPTASTGPAALAKAAAAFQPDVVLLDIVMPVNTARVAAALRSHPDLQNAVVLGCSGHSALATRLQRRLDGFLHKPFDSSELFSAVTEAAGMRV